MKQLDLALIDAYTGGVQMPNDTEATNNYVARARKDAAGRINLEYVPAGTAYAADAGVSAALAPLLRGVGLTVASNKLRPRQRPRNAQIHDYFVGGSTVSGRIGALNWNLLGSGTPVVSRQNSGLGLSSSARLQMDTSATTNNRSVLCLGETESRGVLLASDIRVLQLSWNQAGSLTNERLFFGLSSDFATNTTSVANVLGLFFDSGISATNWQLSARSSSSGSPVDTGIAAIATSTLITIYQPTTGTFQFYVGNTLAGTISSGVPTAQMNVGVRLETLTNSVKTVKLGYFGFESVDLSDALDDDTFLET